MSQRLLVLAALSALLSAGCADNPGVVPTGNGIYMITKSEWGISHTGSTVKADALKQANAFCARTNKEMAIVNATQNDMVPFKSEAQAEIEFRCQ